MHSKRYRTNAVDSRGEPPMIETWTLVDPDLVVLSFLVVFYAALELLKLYDDLAARS